MKIIQLGKSRYGKERYLSELEKGLYSTEGFGDVKYVRVGTSDDNITYSFIDFDGSIPIEFRYFSGEGSLLAGSMQESTSNQLSFPTCKRIFSPYPGPNKEISISFVSGASVLLIPFK